MRRRFVQLCALPVLVASACGRQGPELSRWENPDGGVRVRIIERAEVGVLLPGSYYVFESRAPGGNTWRHVMTFRYDDPGAMPRAKQSVMVKNSSLAYIALGWMFAVTTDGGGTWSVWNAEKDLAGWQCCNYGLIKSVDVDAGGGGTMILNPITGRAGEVPRLRTNDYGRSWASR